VCGYYGPDAEPPKQPGELALEVGVANEAARDLEVSVFEGRRDIGEVEVLGPFD
jgi:hypothetical protein